jgi:hypothetical protein
MVHERGPGIITGHRRSSRSSPEQMKQPEQMEQPQQMERPEQLEQPAQDEPVEKAEQRR